jgi:alpha-glucuronidase
MTGSTAYKAWLNYSQVPDEQLREKYRRILGQISFAGTPSGILATAVEELREGILAMLDMTPSLVTEPETGGYLRIGVQTEMEGSEEWNLGKEGYTIQYIEQQEQTFINLTGGSEIGVLYAVFHLLRFIGQGNPMEELAVKESPTNELRMINHWDNADGSIERGYAGRSIFYRNGKIGEDTQRIKDYARLLASVGLNAISVNNVNVHELETKFITEELLPSVAGIADIFRSYGVTLFLSVNFAAPLQLGELKTADPLDAAVQGWWKQAVDKVYSYIPDFGGFIVKADSEHRPGPFAYGRDHADGANMLADALAAHGGLAIWRCFVYDCMQDWRDRKTDRARAAFDHFTPLDGRFRDNVLLQIKNGPMDFQVREPVSPLLGAMKQTNQVMEFQITQEYTGQQRHLCYLVPQWKQALDFDTHVNGAGSEVKKIANGSLFGMRHSGVAAVSNIGDDDNWTGHILAQANLFGYGRLAWNPAITADEITRDWVSSTFGCDQIVSAAISGMLMQSWSIYESYTAPLGVGWMVAPNHHYGPDVDGYEYSRWGTYHFADRDGIGVDRTQATGTGYTAQYAEPNSSLYEKVDTCPDELLLFFHHVPYTHKLHSGKTVIQHIYDTHFSGADDAEWLEREWAGLEGRIDAGRFADVASRLAEQSQHAKKWRDIINTYFYRKSGIADEGGRTIY